MKRIGKDNGDVIVVLMDIAFEIIKKLIQKKFKTKGAVR